MTTVREQIAAQIKTDNPRFDVAAFPRSAPDNLGAGKVRLSVWREELTSGEPANVLTHKVRIELLVGGSMTDSAESTADVALDSVLLSLQRIEGVRWSTANRTVFNDAFVGYSITVEADSINVYRSTILDERA